jgi:hypothetical protein
MIGQITITTEAPERAKPLVRAAIQDHIKTIQHGIKRTREQLALFEQRFGMTSEEFARRFDGKDLKETLDFLDWWMEIKALQVLEEDYRVLTEARLD